MGEVDLHMHTTRSDGRLTPTELVDLVASQGVKTFAVTDHDTTEGLAEAAEAVAKHPGLTLIDGVELSTDIEGSEIHILCYFVDKTDERFQSELARFREGRFARGKGMVEKLAALGMPLSWERVLEIAGDASVGRPHVARALIEGGTSRQTKRRSTSTSAEAAPPTSSARSSPPRKRSRLASPTARFPSSRTPSTPRALRTFCPR